MYGLRAKIILLGDPEVGIKCFLERIRLNKYIEYPLLGNVADRTCQVEIDNNVVSYSIIFEIRKCQVQLVVSYFSIYNCF